MIEIGKTSSGKIIEIPDILIYSTIFFIAFIFLFIFYRNENKF